MRTSTWLEKLEGGIEQLKKIVVDDKLKIATELESEMQGLVDAYQCEWKQAIENDDMVSRFQHFVNSESTDDNILFVPMREQLQPTAWD